MRFTGAAVAIALAASAQAFLLPPTITESDNDIIDLLPFEVSSSVDSRVVELECPGCPLKVADITGQVQWAPVESVLRLNFSVSLDNRDVLLLNDAQFYPTKLLDGRPARMSADQFTKSVTDTWEHVASPLLGYSLSSGNPTKLSEKEQIGLTVISFRVKQVAGVHMHGFPLVKIKVLETPSGKLMIGDAEIEPTHASIPAAPPHFAADSEKECSSLLCRYRAILAHITSKAKGCGRGRMSAHGKHGSDFRHHSHEGQRAKGPHRAHEHHHRRGGFARFLRSIVLHVFLPIMIGILVGVTTSLIGMIVGHFIVFVWRIVFRRGQRGQYTRVQQEVVAQGDEVKKNLLTQQDIPPPTYEAAPSYEEAVIDEKTAQ